MEIWLQNLIKSHLPELLDITDCNDSLLAILESERFLSSEDTQSIRCKEIMQSKNRCLYEKLLTRTNSFNSLLQGLAKTAQSGAFNILKPKDIIEMNQVGNLEYKPNDSLGEKRTVKDRRMFQGKFGSRNVAIRRENFKVSYYAKTSLLNEISFLTRLDCHKNILRFFTCKVEDILGNILVGFELCSSNLDEYIREKAVSVTVKKDILKQLAGCLSYLHSKDIIYINVRPQCVLISEDLPHKVRPKFSNFSAATYLSENRFSSINSKSLIKSQHWLPGGILSEIQAFENGSGDIKLGFSVDIFALGCLFHYVLFSNHPFGPFFQRTSNIIFKKVDPCIDANFDDCAKLFYKNVIEKMILYENGSQISLENILLSF